MKFLFIINTFYVCIVKKPETYNFIIYKGLGTTHVSRIKILIKNIIKRYLNHDGRQTWNKRDESQVRKRVARALKDIKVPLNHKKMVQQNLKR